MKLTALSYQLSVKTNASALDSDVPNCRVEIAEMSLAEKEIS